MTNIRCKAEVEIFILLEGMIFDKKVAKKILRKIKVKGDD